MGPIVGIVGWIITLICVAFVAFLVLALAITSSAAKQLATEQDMANVTAMVAAGVPVEIAKDVAAGEPTDDLIWEVLTDDQLDAVLKGEDVRKETKVASGIESRFFRGFVLVLLAGTAFFVLLGLILSSRRKELRCANCGFTAPAS